MADKRVISILIAMLTLAASIIVYNISHFSQAFDDIQSEWARKAMDVIIPIAPFAATFSLIVINILVVFVFILVPATDAKKLVVQTVTYVIYRGAFVVFVLPPTHYQARFCAAWLIIVFTFKMYLNVFSDNLHRRIASPSATRWTISRFNSASRIYFTLLMHLAGNGYWMLIQIMFQTIEPSPVGLLLFFEPLSIAFQTLHAILVHGFQLIDIWLHHLPRNAPNSTILELLDIAVGLIWEMKGAILRDVGFLLDVMSLLMSVGHYASIWKLHGMTFNLFDAMLFLPILGLLIAIVRRTLKFMTDLRI